MPDEEPHLPRFKEYTRGGHEYRLYSRRGAGRFSVHGAVFKDGGWHAASWAPDGQRHPMFASADYDLVPVVHPKMADISDEAFDAAMAAWSKHSGLQLSDVGALNLRSAVCAAVAVDRKELNDLRRRSMALEAAQDRVHTMKRTEYEVRTAAPVWRTPSPYAATVVSSYEAYVVLREAVKATGAGWFRSAKPHRALEHLRYCGFDLVRR